MNKQQNATHNYLVTSNINRLSEKRKDDGWIRQQLNNEKTHVVPVMGDRLLLNHDGDGEPRAILPTTKQYALLYPEAPPCVFLGQDFKSGVNYFAASLPVGDGKVEESFSSLGQFHELRQVAATLRQEESSLLAYARAFVFWHNAHRFCGWCGTVTENREAGHLRVCGNEACGKHHFPRTDPAVIVLVSSGDKCLLGRSGRFPGNMYSTLAGFVEPGESLEMTVSREVFEEAGVCTDPAKVRYCSSQPWPFPTSLMLGFFVETEMQEINIDNDELEDAAWFSREEIDRRLKEGSLRLPSPYSIANRLIMSWIDGK